MNRILIGILGGFSVASAAFFMFQAAPQDVLTDSRQAQGQRQRQAVDSPEPDDSEAPVEGREVSGGGVALDKAQSPSVANVPQRESGSRRDVLALTLDLPTEEAEVLLRDLSRDEIERLQERAARADRTVLLAREELRRRDDIERWANEPLPDQPIALPAEFAWLSEDPSNAHERLQREPYDPNWSPAAEAQINSYFAQRPELIQKYGYPTINCRTTGCEIALVAYGIDNPERAAELGWTNEGHVSLDFSSANSEFSEQPWADQFEHGLGAAASVNVQDGTTTILWHLHKESE